MSDWTLYPAGAVLAGRDGAASRRRDLSPLQCILHERSSPVACKVGPTQQHPRWPSVDTASAPWPAQVVLPPLPQEGAAPGHGRRSLALLFSVAPLPTVLNLGFFSLKSRDVIGPVLYSTDSLSWSSEMGVYKSDRSLLNGEEVADDRGDKPISAERGRWAQPPGASFSRVSR